MGIGVIETITRVHRLGRQMHPSLTLNAIKHQIYLLAQTLFFLPVVRKWFDIPDNPLLRLALKRFPLISGAMYWPYMHNNWSVEQRLKTIDQHYRMLGGPAAILAHATLEEVELARLYDEYAGLRLVLDKAIWFLREGEIVLNLFVHDQRFYSIAFTLGVDADGQTMILVGALQGSNTDAAQEVYRNITHALHGMRPRDLIVVALKLLCSDLNIKKIWAISGDNRQHNSPYFGNSHKNKVLVAYNEVWNEHGGTALDNGFFEIPSTVSYKDLSNIPSRKRAAYRRRYQMLDKLKLDITASIAKHAGLPLERA